MKPVTCQWCERPLRSASGRTAGCGQRAAGRAVQAVLDAVGVQQGAQVALGLREPGGGGELGCPGQQGQVGRDRVSYVGRLRLYGASPDLGQLVAGFGEPLSGERPEQGGVDMGIGPAERDQSVVAQVGDDACRPARAQVPGDLVVDCGGAPSAVAATSGR